MPDEISLPSAPIAHFETHNNPVDGDLLVIVDSITGKTKNMNVSRVTPAQPSQNYKWVSTFNYPVDEIVDHQGQWYVGLQFPNLGKNPLSYPDYWEPQPKSSSGFVFWAAGVFTGAEVFVLRSLDSFIQIFRLLNATRPYLSANFEAEYAAGDWELMSERGYVGISKVAHGWAVNDVLTYKTGAWNKYTTGDTPLGIVRVVVSANLVIVSLLGQRLKGLSGLVAGSTYYAQPNATITTTATINPIFLAVSATEAILLSSGARGSGIYKVSVAIVAGTPDTMTINCASQEQVKFENTTAITAAFTLALSNDSLAEYIDGTVLITGTVPMTVPANVICEKSPVEPRFVNGTKIFTMTGGVAEPFEISLKKMAGPKYILRIGYANHAS